MRLRFQFKLHLPPNGLEPFLHLRRHAQRQLRLGLEGEGYPEGRIRRIRPAEVRLDRSLIQGKKHCIVDIRGEAPSLGEFLQRTLVLKRFIMAARREQKRLHSPLLLGMAR
ncbi:hypothetical protein D7V77_35215 [Corallococcus sp. CA041A]|nr:hypothetical protein D7V77_35215 [Corallococcus sp. CA041A]